jgi:hypothetical protein
VDVVQWDHAPERTSLPERNLDVSNSNTHTTARATTRGSNPSAHSITDNIVTDSLTDELADNLTNDLADNLTNDLTNNLADELTDTAPV